MHGRPGHVLSFDNFMTQDELNGHIEQHRLWLDARDRGQEFAQQGRRLDLENQNLSGLSLAGCDLRYARLWYVHMNGVNLQGANLQHALLHHVNLYGASMRGVQLENATLPSWVKLSRVQGLRWAQVSFTDFGEADRTLTVLTTGMNEPLYFCGCFSGTEKEFRAYIKHPKWFIIQNAQRVYESRMLALKTAKQLLKFSA
jgi:uncharacterized protein YjbI with pentapeptide repeats